MVQSNMMYIYFIEMTMVVANRGGAAISRHWCNAINAGRRSLRLGGQDVRQSRRFHYLASVAESGGT
jgi:hypothetical protein